MLRIETSMVLLYCEPNIRGSSVCRISCSLFLNIVNLKKFLNVRKLPAALADGMHDRGKVIVQQNQIRRIAGHVRAPHTHRYTDVSLLEGRRVIHAIPGRIAVVVAREVVGIERSAVGLDVERGRCCTMLGRRCSLMR